MRTSSVRSGFALPAVLAVTGVVTLVFLVAITALASLTAEAASARARVRFLERALTAEAAITYMAATEPLTPQAFGVGAPRNVNELLGPSAMAGTASGVPVALVNLDGRTYTLDVRGPLWVRLQDQAGMINIAALDDDQTERLARRVGIGSRLASDLRSRYIDYIDKDDLRQPNGAEGSDYGAAIANRPLRRPTEWLSILDVRAAVDPARWRSMRQDLATDTTSPFVNVNTATPSTLEILFDLSPPQAEAAIRARETSPFLSLADFAAASGAVARDEGDRLYTYPTGRMIYVITDGRSPWMYRSRLTLTPSGLEQPLWIDQTELTEAPRRTVVETSNATRFPYSPH